MVHCITGAQAVPAELTEDLHLHLRVDVAEKYIVGIAVRLRNDRVEVGEHVQAQVERVANVDVFVVAAAPIKRRAGFALESREVDTALLEEFDMLARKILSDDAHDANRREKTRGDGKIRRRASEFAVYGARGRFDRVERDSPDDEDAHECLLRSFPFAPLINTCR